MMGKQIICATGILVLSCLCGIGVEYYKKESATQGLGSTSGLGFVQQKIQQSHKAMKEEHEEEEEVERKIKQKHAAMKKKHEEDQRKVGQTQMAIKEKQEEKEQRKVQQTQHYWPMPAPAPSPWPVYDQHYWPMPAPAPSPWPLYDQHYWPMPAPAPSPWYDQHYWPIMPSPMSNLSFHVDRGSCRVDPQTGCVTSPSYPSNYPNDENCVITASGKGTFSAKDFQTEGGYDKLFIAGEPYDGLNSPKRISPVERNGGTLKIRWVSDYSVTDKGWKLCPDATTKEVTATTKEVTVGTRMKLAREGQTCTAACQEEEMQCSEQILQAEELFSEVGIRAAAEAAGWNCTDTRSWGYEGNPGICTNRHCCGDGSCTGLCAYGHADRSACSDAPAGHYSRICPCVEYMVGH